MDDLRTKILEASDYIKEKIADLPDRGIILGTGLGSLVDQLEESVSIPYRSIPHFVESTVTTHAGELHFGTLRGKRIAYMAGRFHYYEGYSMKQITFPVRVLKELGIQKLIISNISGGLNPSFDAGDIVLVSDHINLMPEHPLRGIHNPVFGARFPDMSMPYDEAWRAHILNASKEKDIRIHEGVYVALQGPSLETRAEYTFLHKIGGDMVGMSSVPESIVANQCGMKVAMISLISNVCYPPEKVKASSEEEIVNTALSNAWKLDEITKLALTF